MKRHSTQLLTVLGIVLISVGSLASITITKKKFLEDFNHMNGFYKQTLFLTGQSKREEAIEQYEQLTSAYSQFENKYSSYRPFALRNDTQFVSDIAEVKLILVSVKEGVYTGDLPTTHVQLESVRPIFQEMFKRNNFSMLAMALVDFHDIMEKMIAAADAKSSSQVLAAYPMTDQALQLVEKEDTSSDVQAIRKNLEDLKKLAESGADDQLSAKAGELKSSFVKVYLLKG